MPARSFTSGQVTKLTGVSAKTLHGWSAAKLLKPSISEAEGTGSERLYDSADLAAIYVASVARGFGISLAALAPMVTAVRTVVREREAEEGKQTSEHKQSSAVVLLVGDSAVAVESPEISRLMRQHEASVVIAFDIESIRDAVLLRVTEADLGGTLPKRKGRPPGSGKKSKPSQLVERRRRRRAR